MSLDCSLLHVDIIHSPEAEDTMIDSELTRQIMMLIMDDDEDTHAMRIIKDGLEFQRRRSVVVSHGSCGGGLVMSGSYFSWSESVEVPIWMKRLWAGNGGGTGVFIPPVVATATKSTRRRQNKQRKKNANYGGIRIRG